MKRNAQKTSTARKKKVIGADYLISDGKGGNIRIADVEDVDILRQAIVDAIDALEEIDLRQELIGYEIRKWRGG